MLKRWGLIGSLAVVLAIPELAAAQTSLRQLVVFGTSLSDAGNAFALRGGTNTPPDYQLDPFLVPDVPYARGGHHFSNGATWIEQFARPLGLAGSAQPALRSSSAGAANYAVGAARAREDGINFNLSQQVRAFLGDHRGVAPSDALYVIEMGGNDVRDALFALVTGGDAEAIIGEALASIGGNMGALSAAGARKFLVWNVPNLALTPAVRGLARLDPRIPSFAEQLTIAFNSGLETSVLGPLAAAGLDIVRLDVYRKLNEIVANPSGFGLTDVTTACITPSVPPFECRNFDEFLFWDGIHPTTAAHAIIAQETANALPSAPLSSPFK